MPEASNAGSNDINADAALTAQLRAESKATEVEAYKPEHEETFQVLSRDKDFTIDVHSVNLGTPPGEELLPRLSRQPSEKPTLPESAHMRSSKKLRFRSTSLPPLRDEQSLDDNLILDTWKLSAHAAGRVGLSKTLVDSLQRIVRLRMSAVRRKHAVRGQSTRLRNLHRQLSVEVQRLRNIVGSMRRTLLTVQSEEATEWDDCLVNFEGYLDESVDTSKTLDQELDWLIRDEYDMCEEVDELQKPHASDDRVSKVPWRHQIEQIVTDFLAQLPSVLSGTTAVHSHSEELGQMRQNALFEEAATVSHFSEDPDDRLYAPSQAGDDFEELGSVLALRESWQSEVLLASGDVLGSGDQFDDQEAKIGEDGASKADLLQHNVHYSETDLHGFLRWLFYGTPWTALSVLDAETLLPISNLKALRALIWRSLETLCLGAPVSADFERMRGGVEYSSQHLKNYFTKIWLWDPRSRSQSRHNTRATDGDDLLTIRNHENDANLAARRQPVETHQPLLTTNSPASTGDSTASNLPRSRHDTLQGQSALSEKSLSYVGKNDFLVQQQSPKARRLSLP